jgi:hypothetical protein
MSKISDDLHDRQQKIFDTVNTMKIHLSSAGLPWKSGAKPGRVPNKKSAVAYRAELMAVKKLCDAQRKAVQVAVKTTVKAKPKVGLGKPTPP